jgi:isopentenyl diphosphate isomerase/L-lactate dehydrogenase-like FMN-dependent dehydrogenase
MSRSRIAAALNIEDLRQMARRRLPKAVFDFIDGGAEGEWTLRENRAQFEQWGLVPRFPVDVSRRDCSVRLFGEVHAMPLVISPTGMAGLARARADLHLARAAHESGIPFTLSTVSTVSIEEIAANTRGPLWFQLYVVRDRNLTRQLLERARAAGYRALVVTVDCPVAGMRERDPRNGLTVPLRPTVRNSLDLCRRLHWLWELARHGPPRPENLVEANGGSPSGQALTAFMQAQLDPSVTWDEIAWVRSQWSGPLIIKGIASPEDAHMAARRGADGIVVSNHGGRQLDSALPSLEALRRVADSVGSRLTLFCDSGFRRGSDVVKALALGANAVFLGRATLYGAAAAGQEGASRALAILREDIDRTMALTGRRTLSEIDRSVVLDLRATRPIGGNMNIQRHRTNALMSQIVIRADTVYLCGQIADDVSADIQGQTRQVLQKLDSLLTEAGSGRDKLLMATLWLSSMADFAAMNREWEAWLPEGSAPARATVQATLLTPAHKVEVAVIAAR